MATRGCTSCGAPMPAAARFCPGCGAAAGGSPAAAPAGEQSRTPWIVAGVLTVALVAAIAIGALKGPSGEESAAAAAPAPAAAGGGGASAVDIASMSPAERFNRLYARVMQATQAGDMATAQQFMPMAISAYGMLDAPDNDQRYHVALLKMHSSDAAGAAALADTILATQPGHLFAYMIRARAARVANDQAGARRAQDDFLKHYDAEMKANRPEYGEHKQSIDGFAAEARGSKGGATP